MKQFYFLLFILISLNLSAQELLLNGGFESWDDVNTPTSYDKAEYTTQETVDFHGGANSAMQSGSGTRDIAQTISNISGGTTYTISLWYRVDASTADGTDARIWSYWKSAGANLTDNANELRGPNNAYFDNNGNVWTQYTTTLTAPATADQFFFEVRAYGYAIVFWDDFSFVQEATVSPVLGISSPSNGDNISGQSVEVSFSVQNFQVANGSGDGHIHYTVDNGTPIMKYDVDPIQLSNLSYGNHIVEIELVDNNHNPLSTPITSSVTFTNYELSTLPAVENFDYADGSLTNQNKWINIGGTAGDLLVSSGQVVVQHGTASEDAAMPFSSTQGAVYFAFDLSVNSPGGIITGGDYEYFAFLKDDGYNYTARIDIVNAPNGGDYTVGIGLGSTAEATWASDLTFGDYYRIVVKYDQDLNIAQLWVNPIEETDPSISSADGADPGITVSQFGLRQSASSLNEGVMLDNLVVAQTFAQTLSTENFESAASFKIYPNPANTGYLSIKSNRMGVVRAQIFDILGKEVLNSDIVNNQLNISKLNPGVYVIKLVQNNSSSTKKLIIQ